MNRNTILLIVFAGLLAIFLGKKFLGSDGNRNFRDVLVSVDTASVTKIVLVSRANDHESVELSKTGLEWAVTDGNINDDADQNTVRGMLASLVKMPPKRLVAKSEDKWAQYEVNDSLGTQVKVYAGDELLADVMIGKFSFQQTNRSMSTFVRLSEDEEVYSVDGFLSSTFNQQFNSLRDKTFLKTEKSNLTSLRFNYPGDSSFVLAKAGDKWQVNNSPADSAAVEGYLNGIRTLNQREFADDFQREGKVVTYQLTVGGNNMNDIAVQGYMEGDDLILHSSLNENAFFKKGSLDVFDKVFVSPQKFEPKVEE